MRDVAKYLAPVILFVGGIVILSLRIPFWSLLLGIAATQLGIVFIILGFDSSGRKYLAPENYHLIRCENCGDPMVVPPGQKRGLCEDCRGKAVT